MNNIAIVALPPVDDRTHDVSSEKVAHLTLLFLGDTDLSAEAVLYVQHACSELSPFGLSVDYRGTLGDKDADVLFFSKTAWDMKRVKEFRHHLLLNDEIKQAFDSTEQFPEWTPHLTLGYPDAPAEEYDDGERRLHYVDFDRIAVWNGDFEGPEFRLEYDDYSTAEVSMSDMTTAERGELAVDQLFHYGKKGMKWGVRKAESAQGKADRVRKAADEMTTRSERRSSKVGSGSEARKGTKLSKEADRLQRRADKQWNKADDKWEKSIYSAPGAVKVHNAMAEHFNSRINAVNDKHPDADYRKGEDTPEWRAYMSDVNKLQAQSYSSAVSSVHGSSPSGKKKAEYFNDGKGDERIVVHSAHLAHADEEEPDLILLAKTDEQGRLLELNQAEVAVEHSEPLEYFIAHYGVKGMRWGVTTVDRASSVTKTREKQALLGPKDVTVSQRRPGKLVTAKGGQRQTATPEAIKAAAGRQKAKKSTTDALTNDELADTIKRMQLETQFTKLSRQTARQNLGRKFAEALLGNEVMNMKIEPQKGKK